MHVQNFYNDLEFTTKYMLDTVVGGVIMKKRAQEAYELIEDISMNSYIYQTKNEPMEKKDFKSVECLDVDAFSKSIVSRFMKSIKQNFGNRGVKPNFSNVSCIECGSEEHNENDCQNKSENATEVNSIGNFRANNKQNNSYSNI